MAIDPVTGAYVASAAVNAIGQAFGGGDEQARSNLHMVNPAQAALYNSSVRSLLGGGGDFGYGSNIKQGKSQLQDFMASRGVKLSPQSGAYGAAYGNMVGQAQGMDQNARRQYALGLLGTPLQIAQTTGMNFIPNSPSQGINPDQQYNNFINSPNGRQQLNGYGWNPMGPPQAAPVPMGQQVGQPRQNSGFGYGGGGGGWQG